MDRGPYVPYLLLQPLLFWRIMVGTPVPWSSPFPLTTVIGLSLFVFMQVPIEIIGKRHHTVSPERNVYLYKLKIRMYQLIFPIQQPWEHLYGTVGLKGSSYLA
ncbi:hypothetical protein GDO81_009418 [Engystomops pustulosus]|uniref:Uncharacterized protein n=1 Tax=Engystomops pustulosus TaxID=76066 RepID=A0AAV7BRQ4_ENGPU|nr:hypothetical protein GDO81_009418 [Engystomops pustulosus]